LNYKTTFEDMMSGKKGEKDRPGFAAMLKIGFHFLNDAPAVFLDSAKRNSQFASNFFKPLESDGTFLVQ